MTAFSEDLWLSPPEDLAMSNDDVHVWRARLDLTAPELQRFQRILSLAERERADRFFFPSDWARFVTSHGTLRIILARYLATEPAQIAFHLNPHGKPALAAEHREGQGAEIRFNMSHSHNIALYAIARGLDVGIDVERIQPKMSNEEVAERFFSPREIAALKALPAELWTAAFFACWTRKEAYIKATGRGLTLPLDQFDVSVKPGDPARLLRTQGDPQEASRWSLQEIHPGQGYAAALAVEGHNWRLACWRC